MDDFTKELQAVLTKHEVSLVAAPCYAQTKDGYWYPTAEIKIVPTPKPVDKDVDKEGTASVIQTQ